MKKAWLIIALLCGLNLEAQRRPQRPAKVERDFKIVTIGGPITAAFVPGTMCIKYHHAGCSKNECVSIHPGEPYAFTLPAHVDKVTVTRLYSKNNTSASGSFGIQGNDDQTLELEALQTKLKRYRPKLGPAPSEIPPLRSGLVYGWTWR